LQWEVGSSGKGVNLNLVQRWQSGGEMADGKWQITNGKLSDHKPWEYRLSE